jgi:microcystin-dependent protein
MAAPFIAEIRIFGFNFVPRGWASCDGQILPIAQNTALFSLLGTNFGGDGRSTFGLPALQGRCAIGQGQGPGLSDRSIGESGGAASVALTPAQMPQHTHELRATASPTSASPAGATLSASSTGAVLYRTSAANAPMAGQSVTSVGGGQPHENRQPYLPLKFCIALQGVFPPRP